MDLVNKVITKADAYSLFHGTLLGKLHNKLLEVEAFQINVETIDKDLEALSGISLELDTVEE